MELLGPVRGSMPLLLGLEAEGCGRSCPMLDVLLSAFRLGTEVERNEAALRGGRAVVGDLMVYPPRNVRALLSFWSAVSAESVNDSASMLPGFPSESSLSGVRKRIEAGGGAGLLGVTCG